MRILSAAMIAAFFTAGSLAAYAQTAAPATPAAPAAKKAKCKGLTEANCKAPDCTWVAPTGTQTKGKCKKAKAAAPAPKQ
jgi:hypothetical protein